MTKNVCVRERGRATNKKKERMNGEMEREKVGKVKNNINDNIGPIPITEPIVDGLVLLQNSKKLVATDEEEVLIFLTFCCFFFLLRLKHLTL